ncbi:transcription factor A, mitochondrial [Sabethes cyaneus]|uniref:transcription factor A, mitochondrial n=1 Tax=Sabethes cyaneus TaxID=53552 RepID=UPI00221E2B18|nr:transcription factor A, mitochondrial [Sabethes cyaneus]
MQAFGLVRLFNSKAFSVTTRSTTLLPYQPNCGIKTSTQLFFPASNESTLPEKPKRPCNPFIKYVQSVRASLAAKHPKAPPYEITKLAAVQWNDLDAAARMKLSEDFKKEQSVWLQQNAKYLNQLTDQQKEDIRQAREKKSEDKVKREHRKRLKELGKPKRPLNGFLRFCLEHKPNKLNKEENLAHLKRMAEVWGKMSEEEKGPYNRQAADEMVKYRDVVHEWEEKMLTQNNLDVVRRKNIIISEKKGTKKLPRQ